MADFTLLFTNFEETLPSLSSCMTCNQYAALRWWLPDCRWICTLVSSLFSLDSAISISLSLATIVVWEMAFSKELTKQISHTLWLDWCGSGLVTSILQNKLANNESWLYSEFETDGFYKTMKKFSTGNELKMRFASSSEGLN